jgi:SAM-dependent methyltransferase
MDQKKNPWELNAKWWQNSFTNGANAEYSEQLLPLVVELMTGFQKVLDIGSGEGQIVRALNERMIDAVGIDQSENQIRCGKTIKSNSLLLRSLAEHLPFSDSSFDAAIGCLVVEHIEQFEECFREAARVVKNGGRFVVVMNHPLLQSQGSSWVEDWTSDPPEKYWRIGSYLREETSEEHFTDDIIIPFTHRPLSSYVNALNDSGFVTTRMIEPAPYILEEKTSMWKSETSYIPRLLVLVCERTYGSN